MKETKIFWWQGTKPQKNQEKKENEKKKTRKQMKKTNRKPEKTRNKTKKTGPHEEGPQTRKTGETRKTKKPGLFRRRVTSIIYLLDPDCFPLFSLFFPGLGPFFMRPLVFAFSGFSVLGPFFMRTVVIVFVLLFEGIDLNNPTKLRENQPTENVQKPPRPNPFGNNRHFSSKLCFVVFSSCASWHIWAGLVLP